MTPYYQDELITIYNGDSRDVLTSFEDNSIDMILTDPPYGMNYDSGWSGASVHLDGTRLCLRMYRQILPEISRLMRDGSHLYWFTRWDVWPDAYDAIAPFMPVKNALIWDKGHPGMGNLEVYGYSFEMVVFASKGHRKLNGNRPNSIFKHNPVAISRRTHPTEKPVELLREWISRSTNEDDIVLDPFCGSGSVLVAAKELHRKAIGIEIESKYCDLAIERLKQAILPMRTQNNPLAADRKGRAGKSGGETPSLFAPALPGC